MTSLADHILPLLRPPRGEPLTLDEIVHQLTVLRAGGVEMPQPTKEAVRAGLRAMRYRVECGADERWSYIAWSYIADEPPAKQRRMF